MPATIAFFYRHLNSENRMTKLEKPLKRELKIKDEVYVLTISPEGLKITEKGRRKGIEVTWQDLVSGQGAPATGLHPSVEQPR
ncbi:MAG: hypothetical protein ACHQAR_05500 [Steroidobacterales bacterium]